jgi:hypothetical protein
MPQTMENPPQPMAGLKKLVEALMPGVVVQNPIDLFFRPEELPEKDMLVFTESISLKPLFDAIGSHLSTLYPQAVDENGKIKDRELLREVNGLFVVMNAIIEASVADQHNVNPLGHELMIHALTDLIPALSPSGQELVIGTMFDLLPGENQTT